MEMSHGDQRIAQIIGGRSSVMGRLRTYQTFSRGDVQLEASLLRYCELDTLAMVMIIQPWQEFFLGD
jgi:hypothetical protein